MELGSVEVDGVVVQIGADVAEAIADSPEGEWGIQVFWESALPLPEAMALAVRAWDSIFYDPESFLPYEPSVAPTVHGPAVWFEHRAEPEVADALHAWASTLSGSGADGTLRVLPFEFPTTGGIDHELAMIEARVAVPATHVPPTAGRLGYGHWTVDAEVREALTSLAIRWCYDLPRETLRGYVDSRMVGAAVPATRCPEVLALAAEASAHPYAFGTTELVVEDGCGLARGAQFALRFGSVSFWQAAAPIAALNPARELGAVREALTLLAPYTVRGFAKRSDWMFRGPSSLDRWQDSRTPHEREVEETVLLDAFGLVSVPATDAQRVAPLPAHWRLTTVGQQVLIEHDDIDSWYASYRPDAATLNAARAELRPIIRTQP